MLYGTCEAGKRIDKAPSTVYKTGNTRPNPAVPTAAGQNVYIPGRYQLNDPIYAEIMNDDVKQRGQSPRKRSTIRSGSSESDQHGSPRSRNQSLISALPVPGTPLYTAVDDGEAKYGGMPNIPNDDAYHLGHGNNPVRTNCTYDVPFHAAQTLCEGVVTRVETLGSDSMHTSSAEPKRSVPPNQVCLKPQMNPFKIPTPCS